MALQTNLGQDIALQGLDLSQNPRICLKKYQIWRFTWLISQIYSCKQSLSPDLALQGLRSSLDLKTYFIDFSDLFLQTVFEPTSCPPGSRSSSYLKIFLADFLDLFLHKWRDKNPIPNMYKNRENPKNPSAKIQNYVTKFQIYTSKQQIYTNNLQIYQIWRVWVQLRSQILII